MNRWPNFSFSPQLTTGKQYWANYQPLRAQAVSLTAGIHLLRVRFDATPFNFGGLEFAVVSPNGDSGKASPNPRGPAVCR